MPSTTPNFEELFKSFFQGPEFQASIHEHLSGSPELQRLKEIQDSQGLEACRQFIIGAIEELADEIADNLPEAILEEIRDLNLREQAILNQEPGLDNHINGAETSAAILPLSENALEKVGNVEFTPAHEPESASIVESEGTNEDSESMVETLEEHESSIQESDRSSVTESSTEPIFDANPESIGTSNVTSVEDRGPSDGLDDEFDQIPRRQKPELPPKEELEVEYVDYMRDFINNNFQKLFQNNGRQEKDMGRVLAERASDIMRKYDLDPEEIKSLTKLVFYDFVILCDDSGSMKKNSKSEDRVTPLINTLHKVVEIANLIEPSGISVRFLNHKKDNKGWDKLRERQDIEPKLKAVDWRGLTRLGTVLENKIVQPMVLKKMNDGKFEKPLIIIIITDGKPTKEDPDKLEKTILNCKGSKLVKDYGEAAVVFVISRVGSDEQAEEFLDELENKEALKDSVYCSKERLDQPNTPFMNRAKIAAEFHEDHEYTRTLLRLFLAALDQQTT